MILFEMIKKENSMICLVVLELQHDDEIHFDEELHILVLDFEDLKIFFDECDDNLAILDDELALIWKIYFDRHDDFEDSKVLEQNLKNKNQ
jgi:hypothetical protein